MQENDTLYYSIMSEERNGHHHHSRLKFWLTLPIVCILGAVMAVFLIIFLFLFDAFEWATSRIT